MKTLIKSGVHRKCLLKSHIVHLWQNTGKEEDRGTFWSRDFYSMGITSEKILSAVNASLSSKGSRT